MNIDNLKFRDFAKRLISIVEVENKSKVSKQPPVFAVFERLRPCLVQVVGNLGCSAVLSRALEIAKLDFICLREVRVEPDGVLEGLKELELTVDHTEISDGSVVLLAEFFNLLAGLIGERLALQLVQQAVPKISKTELYFGEGEKREKN